jgi:hypothetical protein
MAHLTDEDLVTFFSRTSRPKVGARVVRHLLSGCDLCRTLAANALHSLGLDVDLLAEVNETRDFFEMLPELVRVSGLIKEERLRAKVSFASLAQLGRENRLAALKRHSRYKKYGLAVYVLDEVEALILKHEPAKAKELVNFSMAIADLLRPGVYGAQAIADLKLRQLTTLANVRRLEEDFAGALETLAEADDMRHLGIDPLEEARFYRVQADILFDLGEFEAAAEASEERVAMCELLGDDEAKAKAVLQKAMILSHCDPEAGLVTADLGLALLDPSNLFPLVCGVLNRAHCLIQLKRIEEAAEYLRRHEELIRKVGGRRNELLLYWLDAKIMRERRCFRDAEEILSYVALRFGQEEMKQELLLVNMDRIELRVETGRWKSALNLARHLTPELTSLGLRNDLLSMWATLQEGLASKQTSLIAEIRSFYQRNWNSRSRSLR